MDEARICTMNFFSQLRNDHGKRSCDNGLPQFMSIVHWEKWQPRLGTLSTMLQIKQLWSGKANRRAYSISAFNLLHGLCFGLQNQ